MKIKLDRIISIATLVASLGAIVLVLKRPSPVANAQTPAAIAANAQSFGQKMDQFEQQLQKPSANSAASNQASASDPQPAFANTASSANSAPKAEVHLNSDEVSAALAQAMGSASAGAASLGSGELSPTTNLGSGEPNIKDQQVSFEGDTVHGQFLTEVGGKDVWVTVSGHLGSKDGFATFEPTEFKVGDLNVPVSLVNPALQKKLLEQRDRMKLPDGVGDMKVDKSELVMQQK